MDDHCKGDRWVEQAILASLESWQEWSWCWPRRKSGDGFGEHERATECIEYQVNQQGHGKKISDKR